MASKAQMASKEEFFQKSADELQALKARASKMDLQVREHEAAVEVLSTIPADRKAFRLIGDVLMEQSAGEALSQIKENRKMMADTLQMTVERSLAIEKEVRDMAQS